MTGLHDLHTADAMLRVADVFGDRMVLQRQQPIRLWGTAAPGAQIQAQLGRAIIAQAITRGDGSWELTLDSQEAARDLVLVVSDGRDTITFEDVAIGEVWVAGGQSNMEFHLEFDRDRDLVLGGAMNPDIRFFDVPEISYEGQDAEYDYSKFGWWRSCTPRDLPYFSAVGYYFAEQLNDALIVPVGILGCSWGGTPASAWSAEERLRVGPGAVWVEDFEASLESTDAIAEEEKLRASPINDRSDPFSDPFLYRLMSEGLSSDEGTALRAMFAENPLPGLSRLHPNRPGGLFRMMVQRIAGYGARGVIWYQGESDARHPEAHGAALSAVIDSWRDAWGKSELPFLITQLAPFGADAFGDGTDFPEVRRQQALVAAAVARTWMASSSDSGLEHDVHPKAKRPIGERLALLARKHVYGHDVVSDAPELLRAKRTSTSIEVQLKNAEGLHLRDGTLPLRLTGPDGTTISADRVEIVGDSLAISTDAPVGSVVEFAWTGYYVVELRNAAGLPAVPFRAVI